MRWPTKTEADSYNTSEKLAFKLGLGASRYFNKLKYRFSDYTINVAAHSMGNIVMGQVLKEQLAGGFKAVNNYVAMQAAVPAQSYDVNAPNLQTLLDADAAKPTPNTYRNYLGTANTAVNGQIVNFYNVADFALATGTTLGINTNWEKNQKTSKPDEGLGIIQMG